MWTIRACGMSHSSRTSSNNHHDDHHRHQPPTSSEKGPPSACVVPSKATTPPTSQPPASLPARPPPSSTPTLVSVPRIARRASIGSSNAPPATMTHLKSHPFEGSTSKRGALVLRGSLLGSIYGFLAAIEESETEILIPTLLHDSDKLNGVTGDPTSTSTADELLLTTKMIKASLLGYRELIDVYMQHAYSSQATTSEFCSHQPSSSSAMGSSRYGTTTSGLVSRGDSRACGGGPGSSSSGGAESLLPSSAVSSTSLGPAVTPSLRSASGGSSSGVSVVSDGISMGGSSKHSHVTSSSHSHSYSHASSSSASSAASTSSSSLAYHSGGSSVGGAGSAVMSELTYESDVNCNRIKDAATTQTRQQPQPVSTSRAAAGVAHAVAQRTKVVQDLLNQQDSNQEEINKTVSNQSTTNTLGCDTLVSDEEDDDQGSEGSTTASTSSCDRTELIIPTVVENPVVLAARKTVQQIEGLRDSLTDLTSKLHSLIAIYRDSVERIGSTS